MKTLAKLATVFSLSVFSIFAVAEEPMTQTYQGDSAQTNSEVNFNSESSPQIDIPKEFAAFDTDEDGQLTLSEAQAAGLNDQWFKVVDLNGDENVSMSEFERNLSQN